MVIGFLFLLCLGESPELGGMVWMGEKFHNGVEVNVGNMARTAVTTSEYWTQATCHSFVGCDIILPSF